MEGQITRLNEEYANKTPAELAQLVHEHEERQAWIDANLSAQMVVALLQPFMERIRAKRAPADGSAPTLDTQCVTLLLPSMQALVRRMKNPATDEAITDLLFEPLAGKTNILARSGTARQALASANDITLVVVATFLPTGFMDGDATATQHAMMTHTFTGLRIKPK